MRAGRTQRRHSVEEAGRILGEEEILRGTGISWELLIIEHLLYTLQALSTCILTLAVTPVPSLSACYR